MYTMHDIMVVGPIIVGVDHNHVVFRATLHTSQGL